jgi:hypothetical protein
MATLIQSVQYKIHTISNEIHQLKADAFKSVKAQTYVYKHEDGRVKSHQDYKYPEDYHAGFRGSLADYDKTVSCIGPKHPNWKKYVELKAEASLWLTARLILKIGAGSRPSKPDLRKAIRGGRLGQHSPKRDHNTLIFRAFGLLTTVESCPEVDTWIAQKSEVANG